MMRIRVGIVSSIDTTAGTVRVTFPDSDDMVSGELPVLIVGGLFSMPEVGMPAVCLMLSEGNGAGYYLGTFPVSGAPGSGPIIDGDLTVTGNIHGTVIDP